MKPAKVLARTPRDPVFLTAALVAAGALLQGSAALVDGASTTGQIGMLGSATPTDRGGLDAACPGERRLPLSTRL